MKTINMKYYFIIQIVYAPHATKHTISDLIKLVHPERIHPLYCMPAQDYDKWSNFLPNDIVPKTCKLVVPIETETLEEMEYNAGMEDEQKELENLFQILEKSFLASSEADEYDDVYVESRDWFDILNAFSLKLSHFKNYSI